MAKTSQNLNYALFQGVKSIITILPRKLCLFFGRIIGDVLFICDTKHRRIALKNLKIAFGECISPFKQKRIARRSFAHFGEVLFDFIKFSRLSESKRERLLSIEGKEHVRAALAKGKGVLVVTAHFGNWEFGSILLSRLGQFTVIARALDDRHIEEQLLSLRKSFGAKVIYKQQAMRQTLRSLKENGIVAILIDQNVLHDQAIFVDFFGKPAATTPALALFHLRSGAPIVPAFCLPTASKGYHARLFKPLEFSPTGNHNADVLYITQECTKIIESQIRENPEFWLWFHDRWRTQPLEQIRREAHE